MMGNQRVGKNLGFILLLLGATSVLAEVLTVGIFPRFNPNQARTMYRPLINHLQAELGQPVKLNVSKDYESFVWELNTGRFDLVHFNQYHYIRAHKELGYQAITQNEERGLATIRGAIMVRSDSGIEQVGALKGKRIIFGGGNDAMMSHIVPKQLLKSQGLNASDYQTLFARNPPNAVVATYAGEADAAGSGVAVLKLGVINQMIDPADMKVLVQSEPLAHLPWAVRSTMPTTLRDKIQSVLLGLSSHDVGRSILKRASLTGLVRAKDSDYDPPRAIVADVLGEHY